MSPAPTGELVTSPTLEPTLSLFNSTTAPSISCGVMPDECGEENKCCAGYKCIPIFRKKFCIKVLSQPIIPPINPICLAEKEKCLPLNKITFRERKSYLNCCQGLVCQKTSTQKFPLNYECVKGNVQKIFEYQNTHVFKILLLNILQGQPGNVQENHLTNQLALPTRNAVVQRSKVG